MPRDDWPPRDTDIPIAVIRDDVLPQAAFRLYCKLKALAWGKDLLTLSFAHLLEILPMSRSRFYEHAHHLTTRGHARWKVAGDGIEINFSVPETGIEASPGNRDSASNKAQSRNPGKRDSVSIKDLSTKRLPNPESREPGLKPFELAQALADVCHINFAANKGRLLSEAKQLLTASPAPTPDLLRTHYNGNPNCFWRKHDWRGQKGQIPSPHAIRESWGQWIVAERPVQHISRTPEL